jgi:ribosomal protein L7Ae-like RNA K-turn-binding protein
MAHGAAAAPNIPPGFVVGAKAVLRAANDARAVRRIVVAADAPAAATEPVRRLAAERLLALVVVPSSDELGRLCGIHRPVAALAEVADQVLGTKVPT